MRSRADGGDTAVELGAAGQHHLAIGENGLGKRCCKGVSNFIQFGAEVCLKHEPGFGFRLYRRFLGCLWICWTCRNSYCETERKSANGFCHTLISRSLRVILLIWRLPAPILPTPATNRLVWNLRLQQGGKGLPGRRDSWSGQSRHEDLVEDRDIHEEQHGHQRGARDDSGQ